MGGWQLECAKFGLFIFSPVIAFYWFHRIENLEDKFEEYHRKTTTAASLKNEEMIKEYQQKMRERRDKKFKEELDNIRATENLQQNLANLEGSKEK